MPRSVKRRTLAVVVSLAAVWGCTGKYSMSSYARKGDTVMIAINGEQEILFLRREDLTARLTDSLNVTRTVKVRAVVNIYPDPTSRLGSEKADVADYLLARTVIGGGATTLRQVYDINGADVTGNLTLVVE